MRPWAALLWSAAPGGVVARRAATPLLLELPRRCTCAPQAPGDLRGRAAESEQEIGAAGKGRWISAQSPAGASHPCTAPCARLPHRVHTFCSSSAVFAHRPYRKSDSFALSDWGILLWVAVPGPNLLSAPPKSASYTVGPRYETQNMLVKSKRGRAGAAGGRSTP